MAKSKFLKISEHEKYGIYTIHKTLIGLVFHDLFFGVYFNQKLIIIAEKTECPQLILHSPVNPLRAPFHKGLRLIASFLYSRFSIELRLISIVRLIVTLYETGPWTIVLTILGLGSV